MAMLSCSNRIECPAPTIKGSRSRKNICGCHRLARLSGTDRGAVAATKCAASPSNAGERCCQQAASSSSITKRRLLQSAIALPGLLPSLQPAAASAAGSAQQSKELFCGALDVAPAWAYNTPWSEDLIDFQGYKTWYRDVGVRPGGGLFALGQQPKDDPKLPLLVIHGGPGLPSHYLETVELLGAVERRVIFYDQVKAAMCQKCSRNKLLCHCPSPRKSFTASN